MRYEKDDGSLQGIYEIVVRENFPQFANVKTKLIFDTKKKLSRGKFVMGECKTPRELENFLLEKEVREGYDYFIVIDKKTWEIADVVDKTRLMRHECRHMAIRNEKFTTAPHDIEDFVEEVKLNADNPGWANQLAAKVILAYESE